MAFNYDTEISISVPAATFFKAFVLDYDNLIPKVVPQYFKSVEIIEGDGGIGSIKHITFGEASEFKYIKVKIDGIDKDSLTFAYTVIEGDGLKGKYEKASNEITIVGSGDGAIFKSHTTHYPAVGHEITEEEIKIGKEKAKGLIKAVEAYLLANPNAY